MDWLAVIGALGTLVVTIAGALGAWYLKILNEKHRLQREEREAERKSKKDDGAEQRKKKKETIEEYQEIIEVMREDRKQDRELINALRADFNALNIKYAICERHREEQDKRIAVLTEALRRAGLYPWPTDHAEELMTDGGQS